MRYSRMRLSHKIVLILLFTIILVGFTVLRTPLLTSEPAASPDDNGREDLSRVEYPSLKGIAWHAKFIEPNQSLESLFGADWILVARFNRIDRRHVIPIARAITSIFRFGIWVVWDRRQRYIQGFRNS